MLDLWRGSIHTSQLCSSQWQVADYRNLLVVVVTWWKRGSPTGSEHVHEKWNVFKAYIAEHDQHYHGSKALETMILPIGGGGRLWESSEMFWGSASSTETETLFRKQIPFACKKRRLSCGFYPFRWTFFTCTCNMDDLTCNKNGNLFVINLSLRFGQFMVGWQVFWRGTQMNSCYCWLGTTCVRRNLSLYGLCHVYVSFLWCGHMNERCRIWKLKMDWKSLLHLKYWEDFRDFHGFFSRFPGFLTSRVIFYGSIRSRSVPPLPRTCVTCCQHPWEILEMATQRLLSLNTKWWQNDMHL